MKEIFIEVGLDSSNLIRYYSNLGYKIPKIKGKTPIGTKILVEDKDVFEKRLMGNRYGMLTVIKFDEERTKDSYEKKEYYRFWICKCDCGNIKSINQMALLTGKSNSCGCMFYRKKEDLTGNKYGKLTVIKLDEIKSNKSKKSYWLCKCDCGNPELVSINANSLKSGVTKSCGCIWKESISGENSHYWNGGITNLYEHLRNKIYPWTIDTLINYDRKCFITNKQADVVHHLINFSEIVNESLKELSLPIKKEISDYTEYEMNDIDNLVLKKHYEYNCGIPLCSEMHILFHNIYGYKNNNINQFIEFINKNIP